MSNIANGPYFSLGDKVTWAAGGIAETPFGLFENFDQYKDGPFKVVSFQNNMNENLCKWGEGLQSPRHTQSPKCGPSPSQWIIIQRPDGITIKDCLGTPKYNYRFASFWFKKLPE